MKFIKMCGINLKTEDIEYFNGEEILPNHEYPSCRIKYVIWLQLQNGDNFRESYRTEEKDKYDKKLAELKSILNA